MTGLDDDKAAYVSAQKKRNLFIGLGLAVFVMLVFFTTMARLSHNTKAEQTKAAAARASASSQP